MNDLGTALRELAGEAVAPGPADSEGLWRRGRARAVRRQVVVGVLVAVGAAVVVGLGTFAGLPRAEVSPASGRHAPAVPRNIWPAPSWLPSTAEGPPGTVAAIGVPANGKGRFVISAETGKYSLLALPDYVDSDSEYQLQLAPDGNHIAYWYGAEGRRTTEGVPSATGLAVYDTRTGKVIRWSVPVPAGKEFQPYGTQSILWLDDDHVGFYGDVGLPGASSRAVNFVWNVDRARGPRPSHQLPTMANIGPPNLSGQVLGLILGGPTSAWRHFGYIDAAGQIESGTTFTLPRVAGSGDDYVRATRQGTTVLVEPSVGADESVDVGRVEPNGTVRDLTTIEDLQNSKVLGWTAPDTVLVLGTAELGGRRHTLALYNVTDRRLTELGSAAGAGGVDYTNSGGTPYLQIATDLLRRPMVNGVHPPSLDPRIRLAVLAGGSIVFLTAGAGALVWWRRRA